MSGVIVGVGGRVERRRGMVRMRVIGRERKRERSRREGERVKQEQEQEQDGRAHIRSYVQAGPWCRSKS